MSQTKSVTATKRRLVALRIGSPRVTTEIPDDRLLLRQDDLVVPQFGGLWLADQIERREQHDPQCYTRMAIRRIRDAIAKHGPAAYLEVVQLFEAYTGMARDLAESFEHDVTQRKYERNGQMWLRLQGVEAKQSLDLAGPARPIRMARHMRRLPGLP